jgi:hypothetical protein
MISRTLTHAVRRVIFDPPPTDNNGAVLAIEQFVGRDGGLLRARQQS